MAVQAQEVTAFPLNRVVRVNARSQEHAEENEPVKTNHKLMLAMLAGVSIGVAGGTTVHAGQVKEAPGYVIAEVDVTDPQPCRNMGSECRKRLGPSITTISFVTASRRLSRANRQRAS
jgi:hypothetical protein